MNFEISQEQEMLKKMVRDFAESEIAPRIEELDKTETFSLDITKKMGELGLFGMTVPEKDGGQGLDYLSYVMVIEELSRVDASHAATVAAENSLGIGPIAAFGTEAQKQNYLPTLLAGTALWGFGLTEPNAGSDAAGTQTTAELKNGMWTINGSKIFITNAANEMCAGVTVQAVTGKDAKGKPELSCIIVEKGTPGFTAKEMHGKLVWRASNTAELYFDNVQVPEANLLGARGAGFKQMLATLDSGRLGIAAMGLGGAQGAFELALKYVKEREQFGKAIGSFQVNAFKLADCAMEIEAARSLLYKAAWLKDNGKPFKKEASMAKLYCSEVMYRVVNHAVQLHGGYGLMEEYKVARFYRDQKLLEIGEGTSEIQRTVIARELGCL
ncbi:MAG: acyl-CoA dehydrogenase [Deltaproteobacteria bacterium CG_4_10_14_0_2_um_filter_43_8]|nr:MAG: acyl-CoA dehydrogenase [Deltaproteobacteria bacterium CG11_big_fil_rev_8_21_14_0_20_42_23]PJA19655.1 MAG: acyl-CoA dehydrogenase [Deltaproteobacteria bacterium CG_4_10_14_0_2_um_filter_43_8]PJC63716.1 MAG: acyl-CoA dehydrogenase [Deltaproteobacteria bacterium CG_4_9_14_0_2_um_filter_42_21]